MGGCKDGLMDKKDRRI